MIQHIPGGYSSIELLSEGETNGVVESFNFNNGAGHHLADQNQAICVRRERGNCRSYFPSSEL